MVGVPVLERCDRPVIAHHLAEFEDAGAGPTLATVSVWVVLFTTAAFGTIGWVDDYRKVVRRDPKGLSARQVLLAIAGGAGGGAVPLLQRAQPGGDAAAAAVLQECDFQLGPLHILLTYFRDRGP